MFIPLTVGGGLRTVDDIRKVLRAGADKVALNTATIGRPELVREAAEQFGSSAIVVSIEAMKKPDGRYEAFTDNGRERTGLDAIEWAVYAAELGAGELLVTSIAQEGTGKGYDVSLTSQVSAAVTVPVVASGGAGQPSHFLDAITQGKADAVAAASMFHYPVARQLNSAVPQGNVAFLQGQRGSLPRWQGSIQEVKAAIAKGGVPVRGN